VGVLRVAVVDFVCLGGGRGGCSFALGLGFGFCFSLNWIIGL
jgi:hypothetical protein